MNASSSALAIGFQVGLRLDLDAAPCSGPRDAIRITYGVTELDRYVDELGGTDEWTWFRLQAAISGGGMATDYWLYCANPNAGPAPADPMAVFEFFDDFDGVALSSAWQTKNTVSVGGGVASVGGGGVTDSGLLTTRRGVRGPVSTTSCASPFPRMLISGQASRRGSPINRRGSSGGNHRSGTD